MSDEKYADLMKLSDRALKEKYGNVPLSHQVVPTYYTTEFNRRACFAQIDAAKTARCGVKIAVAAIVASSAATIIAAVITIGWPR